MSNALWFRQIEIQDREPLTDLINNSRYLIRHLNWRPPHALLGVQPFWMSFIETEPRAALACPEEPAGISWIHLFAAREYPDLSGSWQGLIERNFDYLKSTQVKKIAALGLYDWLTDLLKPPIWQRHQDIVVLKWEGDQPPSMTPDPELKILQMLPEDIPFVTALDNAAFEDLWCHPQAVIDRAYQTASYATIAAKGGQIVGYQISTTSLSSAHLARLAVLPEKQNQHIGSLLVHDMLVHYRLLRYPEITVNTQHDNASSIALYHRMGFKENGEGYPVFVHTF